MKYKHVVLYLCTLAFFVTMNGRLAISPVVPEITAEFDISNTVIGAALTGMWLTYALVQFPSGILADRFGERAIILLSIGGTGFMTLVLIISPSISLFFVSTILIGAAAGLHYSVATTLLTHTFTNLGTAIGIHNAGGPAAGLVTPIIVSWIGIRYGWRPAIGTTAIIAFTIFILFLRGIEPTEPRNPNNSVFEYLDIGYIYRILYRKQIIFTTIIAIISDFTWQALASFLPTFLIQYRGYSTTIAGTLFAAYFVFQGVLQVLVGAIADRIGRDFAILICMGSGIIGFILLIGVSGFSAVVAGIIFLGLSMGWGAAVFPRFMDHLSSTEQNIGFGLVRSVYLIIAASGSLVVGLLADTFGWGFSFGFLSFLLLFVIFMIIYGYIR